ncbi:hypothetical protein [Novosphingobium sp. 9U]|uniref:hypothetical protein n=1 Tax=Novosphingobium sp. 9U TaxID=2653158 RepID=UPI0012EF93FE|nr:hypothetical protein [Novosphingobium sp. 9U]VWX53504.1 conserved hypothetical protein [Novosphingobium sp. 9U]
MWTATDKFNAVATGGKEYVIVEMTDVPEGASADRLDPDGVLPRKHTLEDGRELSTEKDGTFILLETDEVLKAVSPSAPAGS